MSAKAAQLQRRFPRPQGVYINLAPGAVEALTRRGKPSNVRPMKSVKVPVPALELFLHEMIPLAKAMGVGVEVSDARALVLTAPKEQNKNSLNTAFGGSLVSLATLAGYGVVWELMKNEKGADTPHWSIVVKESRAAYRRPVLGDLRAICERPAQAAIAEFKDALARYGKAKLKLRARVIEAGETAVDVTAAFVVTR
jgi:thioesterase domain-containing protein